MSHLVRIRRWLLLFPLVVALAACGGPEALRTLDGGADRPSAEGVDASADGPHPGDTPNGAGCFAPGQCQSGFCVDGLCCDTACSGSCLSCASPDQPGVCSPAAPGTDPRGDCTDEGPMSCGQDGMCDGAGACRKYPASVVCRPESCVAATLTFAAVCDGVGACQATSSAPCGAYACGADGKCRGACSTDADCTPGHACVNGSCGPKPPGARCGSPAECASGNCEQGICCTTACAGACQSCAVTGSEGRCSNVPAGQDPLGQCADQGAASCGADGFCDGKGACHVYAVGTVCVQPACTMGRATPAGSCDGAGRCRASTAVDCSPFGCGTTGRCGTTCATSSDCASGFECIGRVCRKRATGAACTAASQCGTGLCQQGVCCASDCHATCTSCALPGTEGTCHAVPNGQDPLGQCTDVTSTNACGTDGLCDGAGGCRLRPTGTACGTPSCAGSTLVLASRCDGRGACAGSGTQPCAPYLCTTAGCATSCTGTGSATCAPGNVCTNGTCGLKPPGTACSAGSECASTFCAQGVCCATACAGGTCRSCSLSGSAGTCVMIPAGQDPRGDCIPAPASTCGADGTCDGAGACRKYASGTICAPATCGAAAQTPARTCDGNGTCRGATSTPCDPFACGVTTCNATCASDADCNPPNVCDVAKGACGPAAPPTADAGG